jgi:hypothetical protein
MNTIALITTYPNKPQEPHRDTKIGVGVYLYYPAPITLSHNQVSKYLAYPHSPIASTASRAYTYRGVDGIKKASNKEASSLSSQEDGLCFSDVDSVCPAPSLSECHPILKHPRRMK